MRFVLAAIALIPIAIFGQIPFSLQDRALITSTSPLRKDLAGYWRLEESGGTRYDRSKNGNHLASNNSVGQGVGKVGNCATFVAASTQYLSLSSNSSLQAGDIDFTLQAWVKLTDKTANRWVVSKDNTSPAGAREYSLFYSVSSDRFVFGVFKPTDSFVSVTANSLGSPTAGVWYHILAWHDAAADTISIQVNNGTVDTTATGGALQAASSAEFRIGWVALGGDPNRMNGSIDEVGLWKRVLTSGERARIYNAGLGVTFPRFSGQYQTNQFIANADWTGEILSFNGDTLSSVIGWQSYGVVSGYNKTFTAYYNIDNKEMVSEKNLATGARLDPVHMGTSPDSDPNHNYTSMAVDSLGYIHAFYGCHSTPMKYRRSTATNSAAAWSSEADIASIASYPAAVIDQSDKIYTFYRTGNYPVDAGVRYLDMITSVNRGTNWSAAVRLIDAVQTTNKWTYHGNIAIGNETPQNSIHIAWTWATRDHLDPLANNPNFFTNIYYMKSLDGGATWKKADGTTYTLPVTPATAELVYTSNSVLPVQVALDTNNLPHILFMHANGTNYWTDSRSRISSWDGSAWSNQLLPGDNYSHMTQMFISSNNIYRVLGSMPAASTSRLQIHDLVSTDEGDSWTTTQVSNWQYDILKLAMMPRTPQQSVIALSFCDNRGTVFYAQRSMQ